MTDGAARPMCVGRTKRGETCPRRADPGSQFCVLHDPERVEEKKAMLAVLGAADRAQQ